MHRLIIRSRESICIGARLRDIRSAERACIGPINFVQFSISYAEVRRSSSIISRHHWWTDCDATQRITIVTIIAGSDSANRVSPPHIRYKSVLSAKQVSKCTESALYTAILEIPSSFNLIEKCTIANSTIYSFARSNDRATMYLIQQDEPPYPVYAFTRGVRRRCVTVIHMLNGITKHQLASRITVITKLVITAEPFMLLLSGPPPSIRRPSSHSSFPPFPSHRHRRQDCRIRRLHYTGGECRFRDGPGQPSPLRPHGKTPMVTYRYLVKCLLKSIGLKCVPRNACICVCFVGICTCISEHAWNVLHACGPTDSSLSQLFGRAIVSRGVRPRNESQDYGRDHRKWRVVFISTSVQHAFFCPPYIIDYWSNQNPKIFLYPSARLFYLQSD